MDAFVAWGDLATVAGRVQDHLDAGADHVALQIFNETPTGIPIEAWRRLVELPEMGHAREPRERRSGTSLRQPPPATRDRSFDQTAWSMKAARLEDGELHIRDVDVPVPRDEEALVRIRAAGVCHSDLHLARGDWQGVPRSGVIGHEAIGVVEALGSGADRFVQVGDRVILGLGGTGGGYWCGACDYCLRGLPRHCAESKGILGTFAECFAVWAPSLVRLPDTISDHEAPLACGGLTAYGAVKKLLDHGVRPGRSVAIIGAAGGLGHYAVQLASAFGYDVIGVDIGADRLDFVRSLGARRVVDADEALDVVHGELGGVDASLVFSARMAGFRLGLQLLRRAGLFVAVGLPPTSDGTLDLKPFELFLLDPTIIYSAVGTVQDMRELVDLAAAGHVSTHVSRVGTLSELGAIFDQLEAGAYTGRAVITDLTR